MNHNTFATAVLRTPLYPVAFYIKLLSDYRTDKVWECLLHPLVKEAIALASPELMGQVEKYLNDPACFSKEKQKHLEKSVLKYIARISTRATPFGLFAGCTIATFGKETNIELQPIENFISHTQFDMQFWTHLLLELGKKEKIREKLVYYPNTSLYEVGGFYRYVEYHFVKKRREHTLAAFRRNEFLDLIYQQAHSGKSRNDLVAMLIEDESEREEALDFINELIDHQFLVSNLEATVTGDQEIERVLLILEGIEECTSIKQTLQEIATHLKKNTLLQHRTLSQEIKEKVAQLEVAFDEKYLLQTDLYSLAKTATINEQIVKKIQQVLPFLGKIQETRPNENLERFKKAFSTRYETREMPLTVVLDGEIGIGYLQNNNLSDTHPILDKLPIQKKSNLKKGEEWTSLEYHLEEKLQMCLKKGETTLQLQEADFKQIEYKKESIPPTFSALIEVVKEAEKEQVVLESLGNFSAAKLIGRFCNGNKEIHQLAKEIIVQEAQSYPEAIVAEIAHLPESRTGNVLRRPVLRTHEIPYLSNSGVTQENQININDLTLSIRNQRIVLKSKKENKEIIPCLSNAHNYTSNALPIYHFLCDLQGQYVTPIYRFDWGVLKQHHNYFPRVVYKEVILAKARWYIYEKETKNLSWGVAFKEWCLKQKLPKYVSIVKGDNTLLLDLEVEIGFEILIKTIKTAGKVILEEFLFVTDGVVKNEKGDHFANQFLVSFKNQEFKKS